MPKNIVNCIKSTNSSLKGEGNDVPRIVHHHSKIKRILEITNKSPQTTQRAHKQNEKQTTTKGEIIQSLKDTGFIINSLGWSTNREGQDKTCVQNANAWRIQLPPKRIGEKH